MTDCDIKHYTESVYYDLELTARYCKVMGIQLFEKIQSKLGPDEFAAMDVISCHPEICQRDLARLILKDRANTGRILNSLEKKGCITRPLDTKNNRLVRKMLITDLGEEIKKDTTLKIKEAHKKIAEKIPAFEIDELQGLLRKLRNRLSEIVDVQI